MSDTLKIAEVVVTAQETRGVTAASVIEKHAMEHLQPSSFSDILELLPGGRSQDPALNTPNTIRIRETGTASSYNTSSLGTSFMIDGAPISTNANRQEVKGAWETSTEGRSYVNSGVDMRTISTDDIEKVEVVRGIPSVEYGDLTSGLVKIERKRGGNNWEARLKADMDSKLFYLAKGFEWKPRRMTLNLSIDYLDAKADPRNRLENYKRLSFSARFFKAWSLGRYDMQLKTNFDYTGSFDNDKNDPDLDNQAVDSYKSQYNRYALNALLRISYKSDPKRYEELNPVIYKQLLNIADHGPVASSMDKVKKYLKKQYGQMAITNDYWSYVIWHQLDDDADFDKDYCKMVDNLTASDVQKMAKELLKQNHRVEVTMLSE